MRSNPQYDQYRVVRTLIKGKADVNFSPRGRPGPLQTAVIHDSEACAKLLLRNKANPNLRDSARAENAPLHLAALCRNDAFADMLLSHGASPLLQNAYEASPLTLARPGWITFLCLAKCFQEVQEATVLHRHSLLLHSFGCSLPLWGTCKALRRAKPDGDLAGGSSQVSAELNLLDSLRWARLCQNRAKVFRKKRTACGDLIHRPWGESMPPCLHQSFGSKQGIRLPLPDEGWLPTDLGCMPSDFLATGDLGSIPTFDFLKRRNSHERDRKLKFDGPSHTYYVDGIPLDLSVTRFLAAFQEPFDADAVICRMEESQTWPRQGYLTFKHIRKVEEYARGFPFLWPLLSLLQGHPNPIDQASVCQLLQRAPEDSVWNGARYLLTMTRAEIKGMWKRNGEVASRVGTWAHLQCECVLNGGQVSSLSPEMSCLSRFLQTSGQLLARRTEWSIWATDEKLAGAIDFCATDPNGCLVLVDWKRSKNLKTKYFTSFKQMKGDLSHIPDAVGWKYRLQLNLYKYIIEKYYGFFVSRMLVVDIHPDAHEDPFVDEVPNMQMDVRQILRARQVGGAAPGDVRGGACFSEVAVTSALTGEALMCFTMRRQLS